MESYNANNGGTAKKSRYESAAHVKQQEHQEQQQQQDDAALRVFMWVQASKDELVQTGTSNQNTMTKDYSPVRHAKDAVSIGRTSQDDQCPNGRASQDVQLPNYSPQAQLLKNNNGGGGSNSYNGGGDRNADRGKENIHNGRVMRTNVEEGIGPNMSTRGRLGGSLNG